MYGEHFETYVWDTNAKEGKDGLQVFLEHVNVLRPSSRFAMEMEKDGKLVFLVF